MNDFAANHAGHEGIVNDESLRRRAEKASEAIGVARVRLRGGDAKRYMPYLPADRHAFISGADECVDALFIAETVLEIPDLEKIVACAERSVAGRLVLAVVFGSELAKHIKLSGQDIRSVIEGRLLSVGWRKHPATCRFSDYETMGREDGELIAVFEPVPDDSLSIFPMELLQAERDLHMDMLREPGARSDAHVVRYEWAANFVRCGDRVLDAACGMGYGSHIIAHRSWASSVTGLDESGFAIAYANSNYGSNRTSFAIGSLPDSLADIHSDKFDCIVSFETLEHVEDPERLLSEFWRILAPGGRLLVSVPNDWADESGKDPNPYHLHVYDWGLLSSQIGKNFIVEELWQQIASGCKQGTPRFWRESPRRLRKVECSTANEEKAEWWLLSAMKSPLTQPSESAGALQAYAGFQGKSSLVDFDKWYANPQIIGAMVEMPHRLRNTVSLEKVARELFVISDSNSADAGAALAVEGYQLLERIGAQCMSEWIRRCDEYINGAVDSNPHVRRWRISLLFLMGLAHSRKGDSRLALNAFSRCMASDFIDITPTLGTKIVEAAFRTGLISFSLGDAKSACESWKKGLSIAELCFKQDWIEFIGDRDAPYEFSMNDLVEIADAASRCAGAIRASSRERAFASIELAEIGRRSLRSALNRLTKDMQSVLDSKSSLEELNRLAFADADRLRADAMDSARLAEQGRSYIHVLEQVIQKIEEESKGRLAALERTTRALEEIQSISLSRMHEAERLDAALSEAQTLSIARMHEAQRLDAALSEAQTLSIARMHEAQRLDAALSEAQALSIARMHEAQRLDAALSEAQALSIARMHELERLGSALSEAQFLAVQRESELIDTQRILSDADAMISRLTQQMRDIAKTRGYRFLAALHLLPPLQSK